MPQNTETRLGGATFDRNRRFGVEMECYGVRQDVVAEELRNAGIMCHIEGYNHETRAHWKIVVDGSIQGANPFELVSPPMRGDEGLETIKKVCAVLNRLGVKVNRSTGLHVHHEASDLTADHIKAVLTFYWKYEDVLEYFLPPSRRNNFYAQPAFPRGGACGYAYSHSPDPVTGWRRALDQFTRRDQIRQFMTSERYAVVNLAALPRHGTLEFRQHGGTVNADKIIAWVALTQWMLTRAKAKGCRVAARMVGRWAEKAMFFWKAIDWINLSDPVIINAKNTLNERFKYFKELASDGRRVNGSVDPRTGRPRIDTTVAQLDMEGEAN